MNKAKAIRRRGTPFAILVLLLGGWASIRIATWDNPIVASPAMARSAIEGRDLDAAPDLIRHPAGRATSPAPQSYAYPQLYQFPQYPVQLVYGPIPNPSYAQAPPGYVYYPVFASPPALDSGRSSAPPQEPRVAQRQGSPFGIFAPDGQRATRVVPRPSFPLARELDTYGRSFSLGLGQLGRGSIGNGLAALAPGSMDTVQDRVTQEARTPFAASPPLNDQAPLNRWMLDAYGFYRQGSGARSLTQGPRPIYGASQLAANLQWRANPSSGHDPRLYARAYHALVTGGESELAGGISAKPLGTVPIRLYSELRVTRNPAISEEGISSRTRFRPAVYAVSELPPQKFPLGFSLEAYGAGGYVFGNPQTYFADGQASLTRSLTRIGKPGSTSALVSLGAGIWGGAQRGAQRIDIGPTLRFDVKIGDVPARVSVDYREQVAGDAEPGSGVAATVSTRF